MYTFDQLVRAYESGNISAKELFELSGNGSKKTLGITNAAGLSYIIFNA